MFLRPLLFSLALLAACLPPLDGGAARAQADVLTTKPVGEVIERPRLVITMTGKADFLTKLATRLDKTQRFQVVTNAKAKDALKKAQIVLDGKLSVEKSRKALAVVGADLVLDGEARDMGGAFKVTGRLYDFRTGEITRDLALLGEGADGGEQLADQLASFVRHSVPLKTVIKAMLEDQVVLDLGATDGVRTGTMFKVFRHPRNLKPREVGVVVVVKADAFVSTAEVESTAAGMKLEEGDTLIEQTAGFMLSP